MSSQHEDLLLSNDEDQPPSSRWSPSALLTQPSLPTCQVLGLPATPTGEPAARMIVPARPEQRRQPLPQSALPAAK